MTMSSRFIVLKVYLGDLDATKMSPTFMVDKLWHAHILETPSYIDMCESTCNTTYIHHRSTNSRDGKRGKRLQYTRGAYDVLWPGDTDASWIWAHETGVSCAFVLQPLTDLVECAEFAVNDQASVSSLPSASTSLASVEGDNKVDGKRSPHHDLCQHIYSRNLLVQRSPCCHYQ